MERNSSHFRGRGTNYAARALKAPFVLVAAIALMPAIAAANCVTNTATNTTTCDASAPNPWTTVVGTGRTQPVGSILNILPGAQLINPSRPAVSFGNGAIINMGAGSSVINEGISPTGPGPWAAGPNAMEFGANVTLNVAEGATIATLGPQGEPVDMIGTNSLIINRGLISAAARSAIYSGSNTAVNTIDNYGVIETGSDFSVSAIGSGGAGALHFFNRTGATLGGSLLLGRGNDVVTLETGSTLTGNLDGGAGSNTLQLGGAAGTSDAMNGALNNFSTLKKIDGGRWTLSDSVRNTAGGDLAVSVEKGTLELTGDNSAFKGSMTILKDGTLEARAQSLPFLLGDNSGLLRFAQADDGTYAGIIRGTGAMAKTEAGVLTLTGASTYSGGTTIEAGTLQLGDGATTGSIAGNVLNNSQLTFNPEIVLALNGAISGSGAVTQRGTGVTRLQAANSYTGTTTIESGELYINGNQSGATGLTTVQDTGWLGGNGTIGGSVYVADGGTLAPGDSNNLPGKLVINGDLVLSQGAILNYSLGEPDAPGGSFNDLVTVNGDLTLDGTLDVHLSPRGMFGPGLYRLMNYTGTLTDNGLELAAGAPPDTYIQTSIAQQVNLLNTAGMTLERWDGEAGPKNDGVVNGGDGVWQSPAGNDNWASDDGRLNYPHSWGSFALFSAAPGTVTVDTSLGEVKVSGMQFASSGYRLEGDSIILVNSTNSPTQSVIRVGDGTQRMDYSAIIDSELTGDTMLVKTDSGTLVLNGANTYTGGTLIDGGNVQISRDENLGDAAGVLKFDGGALSTSATLTSARAITLAADGGTLLPDADTQLTLDGAITGSGKLIKNGAGTVVLNGLNSYTGNTVIRTGALLVGDASHTNAAHVGSATTSVATDATFGGYGSVTGTVNNLGTLAVADAAPAFAGGPLGSFRIKGTLNNAGTVMLAGATAGNTLRVSRYNGQNGTLAINTQLGDENSPTDRLIIDGGQATGATRLLVHNLGGVGALTKGNGIQVVATQNGATTSKNAFALGNRVIGGPYEYRLFRGALDGSAADDWYLRSRIPGEAPDYRREVSDYTALSSMMVQYGRQTIGTRDEREGGAAQAGSEDAVWVRVLAHNGQVNGKTGGIHRDAPSFDLEMTAVEVGATLLSNEHADGSQDRGGVYATVGRGNGAVEHYDGSNAGSNSFKAVSLAGFWSHDTATDAYVQAVVQGTRFYDVKSGTQDMGKLKTSALGAAVSLEGGKPFKLEDKWTVEPQAQVVYQNVQVKDSHDKGAKVDFGPAKSLATRVGVKVSKDIDLDGGGTLQTWVRPSVWHEINAKPATSVSSADGDVAFHSNMRGTWSDVTAGFTAPVSKDTSVFGTVGFQAGSHSTQGPTASLGVQMRW